MLCHLVTVMKIKSLEEIYLFSLPIKESEIIDYFLGTSLLKDEVLEIMLMQKQTHAYQQARFKAFADISLNVKYSNEVATAIVGPST